MLLDVFVSRPASKLAAYAVKRAEEFIRGMQNAGEVVIKERGDAVGGRVIKYVIGSCLNCAIVSFMVRLEFLAEDQSKL